MSTLVLDGNVFGLQVHGGVSGYTARLLVEFAHLGISAELIQPQRSIYRGFGATDVNNAPVVRRERIPARIAQYLPAMAGGRNTIFHSAYYRRPLQQVARHVVTVHDFTYERFRSGPPLWVHHRLKVAAILAADAAICISEATRRDTLEFCPSIDPAKLHVVPHGVDLKTFHPDPTGAPEAMDHTVLFVGQRGGYKRFDLAVDSLASLPDLRLGFVGPPPSTDEMALLDRRIGGRWIWFGQVNNATLRALYASAYGFIFPSDYEGFGLPVLEAMACGCPVVTSSDAALREVGGEAALFAVEQRSEEYADELLRLGSTDCRASLVERGHAVAAQSTWQQCARDTLGILDPTGEATLSP